MIFTKPCHFSFYINLILAARESGKLKLSLLLCHGKDFVKLELSQRERNKVFFVAIFKGKKETCAIVSLLYLNASPKIGGFFHVIGKCQTKSQGIR